MPAIPPVRRAGAAATARSTGALTAALAVVLAAGLLVAPTRTGHGPAVAPGLRPVSAYTPRTGATFNNPLGGRENRYRIHFRLNRTIDAVPRHGAIRMAVFSLSEKGVVDALLRARARGVSVRVIFDDHTVYSQQARLRRALGGSTRHRSYVLFCRHACRGTSGDMHDKVFLFSRAGRARNVTMVGSNNMTSYNAERQWSDVLTVAGNRPLYRTYARLFGRMVRGRLHPSVARASSSYTVRHGRWSAQFLPAPGVSRAADPAMRTLRRIGCRAGRGTGRHGHTVVHISQHAWFGDRGRAIAGQVAGLSRRGCRVRVIPGVSVGAGVRDTLKHAGVRIARVRHRHARTHQKVLTVSGRYGGRSRSFVVFTGSHNYTDRALRCDDTILGFRSRRIYAQYAANFRHVWYHG